MISIVIPVHDRLEETKGIVALLPHVTRGQYELIVVDSSGARETQRFYHSSIRPLVPHLQYVPVPSSPGVLAALAVGCRHARGEVVACLHNDLFIYTPGWDQQVLAWFRALPRPGVAGFAGYRGCGADGWGTGMISTWADAEAYGARLQEPYAPVTVVHGSALLLSRPFLEWFRTLDPGLASSTHYDHELSLASLHLGFNNWVLNIASGHEAGADGRRAPRGSPRREADASVCARRWAAILPRTEPALSGVPKEGAEMLKRDPRELVPIPPGQTVSVDLGCHGGKRGHIGVNREPGPGVDVICNLGFEPLPFQDDSVDYFIAYDFLEHVPGYVFYREDGQWKRIYPRIELMREIYRCLKPGGRFESYTPCAPHPQWAQDPTHTSPPWVRESWPYYCGGYGGKNGLPGAYGIDFEFRLVVTEVHGFMLRVIVEKPGET